MVFQKVLQVAASPVCSDEVSIYITSNRVLPLAYALRKTPLLIFWKLRVVLSEKPFTTHLNLQKLI